MITKQGSRCDPACDPLLANLETRRVVGDPAAADDRLGGALWNELGCGVDADGAARRRLPIASPVPAQQAPRRCRCPDEAVASPLVG